MRLYERERDKANFVTIKYFRAGWYILIKKYDPELNEEIINSAFINDESLPDGLYLITSFDPYKPSKRVSLLSKIRDFIKKD